MTAEAIVKALTADHVVRLTGLSKHQLAFWDKTGFFQPQFGHEDRRSAYSRVYSFRDVVGLRVISILRNKYNISLQHLRKVAEELAATDYAFWANTVLYVANRRVVFNDPETGQPRGILDKQYEADVHLSRVIGEVASDVERLKRRRPEQIGQIERHRRIAHNRDVIAGTRIPVGAIKRFAEAGYSTEAILREYPTLTRADIEAALKHRIKGHAA